MFGTLVSYLKGLFLPPQAISPYLPRGDPVLKPLIYEMILHEFLESDYEVRNSPTNKACSQHVLQNLEIDFFCAFTLVSDGFYMKVF